MTHVVIHIGPDRALAERLQTRLEAGREALARQGVLFATSPGARNHTRAFMAVTAPESPDLLRSHRGFADPARQADLREQVAQDLAREVADAAPDKVILSAHQFGAALSQPADLERLADLVAPFATRVQIVAYLDDPARMVARRYATQVLEGRVTGLTAELACAAAANPWDAALAMRARCDPARSVFADVQTPVFWMDFQRLAALWNGVFGAGAVTFHSVADAMTAQAEHQALKAGFGVDLPMQDAAPRPDAPSAAWLARCRAFNAVLLRYMTKTGVPVSRQTWRRLLSEMSVEGPAIAPGSLAALSGRFAGDIATLCEQHAGLTPAHLAPDPALGDYCEADPMYGFRATQYLAAFAPRLRRAAQDMAPPLRAIATGPLAQAKPPPAELEAKIDPVLSPAARQILPPAAKLNVVKLGRSPYAPKNPKGGMDESRAAAPYPARPETTPRTGTTGTVIVACMKNEAPYIVEWIAYHRAIGVDHFLIYTNDCDDSTADILDRLQAMGLVQHRDNSQWTGKSPQQFALDAALHEPVVLQADWLIHIDVDEFINVRIGDGTLAAVSSRFDQATNIAMTWRLFGHNGIVDFADQPVIAQFDRCAPRYCPKPHTAWGYKTMYRNIGAYTKMSCHRPNRLDPARATDVYWINGSGKDITAQALKNGWRSSRKTVGYDAIQLNHYALRSAESYLIKRQRGRALHVDRSIGLNYWVRMDWSTHLDLTIQRNLPRLREAMAALLADADLARAHQQGVAWHRARAVDLRKTPEFSDLLEQAMTMNLTDLERAAYSLTLDTET